MRLLTFFLFAACLSASASGTAQSVTISGEALTYEQVFTAIKKQTGYVVMYDQELLSGKRTFSLSASNLPLHQFLDMVLKDQPVKYQIVGKTIFLSEKFHALSSDRHLPLLPAAPQPIKGRVLDSVGQPLSGATITVKNSKVSGVTDTKGVFNLNVNQGDVLLVSYVGYETRSVSITPSMLSSTNDLVITLTPSVTKLEEVDVTVNTGYQRISRERSAGSFARPDMEILANRSTSMNILQRLDGLVPGLTINNAPGKAQNSILIRGLTTIGVPGSNGTYTGTNRSPLIVVDGIPIDDINTINPQDVETISVLKDATASSIWGARASNGVIVITMKKGKKNEKATLQYDGFVSFQGKPDLNYIPVLSSRQFIQAAKDVFDPITNLYSTASGYVTTGGSGIAPHEMILYNQARGLITASQANASLDSLGAISNKQQIKDFFYRNDILNTHTISASGGTNTYSFYGSLAYTGNQTTTVGESDHTYKINLRQDLRVNNRIQVYLIADLTNQVKAAKRTPLITNWFYPYQLFADATGVPLAMPYMATLSDSTRLAFQEQSRIDLNFVPLDEMQLGSTKTGYLFNRVTSSVSVSLVKGLRYEGVFGLMKGNTKTTSFDDGKSYTVRQELVQFTVAPTPSSIPVYYLPATGGKYSVSNVDQRNWTVRNQLIYDNGWNNGRHQLTVLAGQEAQEKYIVSNSTTLRGYDPQLLTYGTVDYTTLSGTGLSNTVMPNSLNKSLLSKDLFGTTDYQFRFTSYYTNAGYTFDGKYTINGSWRIDQSNLFGKDRSAQNKPVTSVGIKWALSKESFMRMPDWINMLAVRATYGITGNSSDPGTSSSSDVLQVSTSSFYPNNLGLLIATAGNPSLTWESTRSLNLGADFRAFNNRISGSLDLYSKKTSNLLGDLAVNGFTGYSSIIGNRGDMNNKGVELSLQSANISNNDFNWSTQFTMAYNRNKITRLNSLVPITSGTQKVDLQYLTDYPAMALFAYRYAGLDNMGDPTIRLNDNSVTKTKSAAKPEDIVFMGSYQPAWNGGLSNIFGYKAFSLVVNMVYSLDYVMRRDVNTLYNGRLTHNNVQYISGGVPIQYGGNLNAEFDQRWKKPGDEAITNIPSFETNIAASSSRDVNYYLKGDINVLDASYIKIRDITLSYRMPQSIVSRLSAAAITFRVQVSNLMFWKANHYGIDPEFQNPYTGERSLRMDQGAITFGAHVSF